MSTSASASISPDEGHSKENRKVEIHDNRNDLPIFIHSALDEYGLSCVEFRVYARLARRCGSGAGFESVPNMARDFGTSDRTIQRSLQVLVACRLIGRKERPGKSTLYTLNPQSAWLPKSNLARIREMVFKPSGERGRGDTTTPRSHVTGDTKDGGGVTQQHRVVVTPEKDEGTPIEGTPSKVLPHPPPLTSAQPPPQQSTGVGGKSKFCFEERKRYADAHGMQNGWMVKSVTGIYDEVIADWLDKQRPERIAETRSSPSEGKMGYQYARQLIFSLIKSNHDPQGYIETLDVEEDTRNRLLDEFVRKSLPPQIPQLNGNNCSTEECGRAD